MGESTVLWATGEQNDLRPFEKELSRFPQVTGEDMHDSAAAARLANQNRKQTSARKP